MCNYVKVEYWWERVTDDLYTLASSVELLMVATLQRRKISGWVLSVPSLYLCVEIQGTHAQVQQRATQTIANQFTKHQSALEALDDELLKYGS